MFKEGKDTVYTTFIQLPFNSDSNKFYLNTSRLNTNSWFYKGCCIGKLEKLLYGTDQQRT